MPRVLLNETIAFYSSPVLFAVDRAVGRGSPNDRLDVLLVQYMLRAYMGEASPYQAPAAAPGVRAAIPVATPVKNTSTPAGIQLPGGVPIVIDGVCGDQTIAYIEAFQ